MREEGRVPWERIEECRGRGRRTLWEKTEEGHGRGWKGATGGDRRVPRMIYRKRKKKKSNMDMEPIYYSIPRYE